MEHPELVMKFLTVLGAPLMNVEQLQTNKKTKVPITPTKPLKTVCI